jgi:FkbM family methyltransferase
MSVAQSVKAGLRRFGIEIKKANPMTVPEFRLPLLLRQHNVVTVLDVGANEGQYGTELFQSGWTGSVLSFEALPSAWAYLQEHSKGYPNWDVYPQIALSDRAGTAVFYEAGNSASSSLLEMTRTHVDAAPHSATKKELSVQTQRLDEALRIARPASPLFLKIDVQGAEAIVLDGATEALRDDIVGVQVEMSIVELYSNQILHSELEAKLTGLGFRCWDIIPGFRDPASLRLLQYDAVYFKD